MRKRYVKPEASTIKVHTEGILKENSWSPDGGKTKIPIVEGNPDNQDDDPYGYGNNAKGETWGLESWSD